MATTKPGLGRPSVDTMNYSLSSSSPSTSSSGVAIGKIYASEKHDGLGTASGNEGDHTTLKAGTEEQVEGQDTEDFNDADAEKEYIDPNETSKEDGDEDEDENEEDYIPKKSQQKSKKTTTKKPADREKPEQDNDRKAEARRDFDEVLAKIKAGKVRRKKSPVDSSDVIYDDEAIELHSKMLRAAQSDNESVEAGRPALKKLELLPQVLKTINTQHMQEFLLDNRILEGIRMWLEPLPNGTLPSVDLRLALLEALQSLTPAIDTQCLRESRVGRIVMFFSVRSGEYPPIQRLATQLVTTWSRPIVGHSADLRAMRRDDFVQSDVLKRRANLTSGSPQKNPAYSKIAQHFASSHSQRRRRK